MNGTKTITLAGREVHYTLVRSSRSGGLRLSVLRGGEVRVTAPPYMADFMITAFLNLKAAWVVSNIEKMASLPKIPTRQNARERYEDLKEHARFLARTRLAYFNTFYGYRYNTIAIRDQKTRWGSCSSKGNLNFSYKIAVLPPELSDYIIVHELCHLKEMNHSSRFWDLVHKTIPDYRTRKRHLKERALEFDV